MSKIILSTMTLLIGLMLLIVTIFSIQEIEQNQQQFIENNPTGKYISLEKSNASVISSDWSASRWLTRIERSKNASVA